jgi:hypothetical protein
VIALRVAGTEDRMAAGTEQEKKGAVRAVLDGTPVA